MEKKQEAHIMNKVTFETHGCVGCRTCEIACSHHHKKVFSPNLSSIEIIDQPEKLGFTISFYIENENDHLACDRCEGEDEALCIKYCHELMRNELETLILTDLPGRLHDEVQRGK